MCVSWSDFVGRDGDSRQLRRWRGCWLWRQQLKTVAPDYVYPNRLKLLAKLEKLLGKLITNSRLLEMDCWEYFVGHECQTVRAMLALCFTNSGKLSQLIGVGWAA
jgi:hypothetical protein